MRKSPWDRWRQRRCGPLRQAGLNLMIFAVLLAPTARAADQLPGTNPLTLPENLVETHQQQVVEYFEKRIADAERLRDEAWKPDFTSSESYLASIERHRAECLNMLGLERLPMPVGPAETELLGQVAACRVERVRIAIEHGVFARGLLFIPRTDSSKPVVIVCGEADTWPEKLTGVDGSDGPPKWLTQLLARGAMVYVPQSVERLADHAYCKKLRGFDRRKILYRLGYLVGRTMTGLDVEDMLAAVDYLCSRSDVDPQRIAVAGLGQGGMTALYAAAVDRRLRSVVVAGYFQRRDRCFEEPFDRRMPRQLLEFGDAEVAALIAPRPLVVVHWPESAIAGLRVTSELARATRFYAGLGAASQLQLVSDLGGAEAIERAAMLAADTLSVPAAQDAVAVPPTNLTAEAILGFRDQHFDERLGRLRRLIEASEAERYKRWGLLARPAAEFEKLKAEMLADYRLLVGEVPIADTPINPRTELAGVTEKYKAYRVILDVTGGVEVYGNLFVPRNLRGRAAAVICQHGLNGVPEHISGLGREGVDNAYHQLGRRLAEHGYVVFAPLITHHYWNDDPTVLNQLAWRADAVGMMRAAMVVAKTDRVIDFLETLPFVDGEHIGYYGWSYGGYSATWCAPLVDRLAATVISGNFNDRREKLASNTASTSYLRYPYEDMYYWDLLHRCTDPEQMLMVAPRGVCVEVGSHDGTTTPAWAEAAWRQTVALRDRFGLTDRMEMVAFDGVHEIHAVGTIDFLDRMLRPAEPVGRDYPREKTHR